MRVFSYKKGRTRITRTSISINEGNTPVNLYINWEKWQPLIYLRWFSRSFTWGSATGFVYRNFNKKPTKEEQVARVNAGIREAARMARENRNAA